MKIGFILAVLCCACSVGWADSCPVVKAHESSPAEQAFLAADYEKAVGLYQDALRQAGHANDPELTAGLVRVMLRQQKADEAAELLTAALAANPKSAVLITAKAEVEYRQGAPWDAAESIEGAYRLDPCLPRVHLVFARIARLNSYYAAAQKEVRLAHQLDPADPDIWGEWIGTLPARERAVELEKYLKAQTGDDAEERHHTEMYLDHTRKSLEQPHKACRLASTVSSTEIPLTALMYDARHVRALGLEVKLNQKKARLEVDTGAGGLSISRSVAKSAGLQEYVKTEVGGIGDKGENAAYAAYVDSIQVGNLEFHDCMVEVVDNKHMLDIDGLIGLDVFAKFLVTLDFPDRKLALGPLPPRPGQAVNVPTLGTDSGDEEATAPDKTNTTNAPGKNAAGKDAAPPDGAARASDSSSANSPDAKSADSKNGAPNTAGSSIEGGNSKNAAVKKGPYDRYIAPEMNDYTPVYRNGHILMLPVSLNHSKLKLFVLDTGAWATSISPAAAREVTKVHSDSQLHVRGLSGEIAKAYSADEITFSFAKIAQKIYQVPSFDVSHLSKNEGIEISGFLGARTLQQTTIHIDYRDGLVKFDYDPKKVSSFTSF